MGTPHHGITPTTIPAASLHTDKSCVSFAQDHLGVYGGDQRMKPLIAPHAMVMKQNGKIFPAKTGPLPSMKR